MEQPPKGVFLCYGNASWKHSSVWPRSFGPMKLISSISMYLICLSSSWNFARALPSKGVRSFIGRCRAEWIVDAHMLKVATHVGARSMISEGFGLVRVMSISLMQLIRMDFPVPAVPCIVILRAVKQSFLEKWLEIIFRVFLCIRDNVVRVARIPWCVWIMHWMEWLFSMNCLSLLCRSNGIVVWFQLWLSPKPWRPSMSRSFMRSSFVGCNWESNSHSFIYMVSGGLVSWIVELSFATDSIPDRVKCWCQGL